MLHNTARGFCNHIGEHCAGTPNVEGSFRTVAVENVPIRIGMDGCYRKVPRLLALPLHGPRDVGDRPHPRYRRCPCDSRESDYMNRINQPEEVSSTIFWLLTNAPDNITGQIINVDGGMAKARS